MLHDTAHWKKTGNVYRTAYSEEHTGTIEKCSLRVSFAVVLLKADLGGFGNSGDCIQDLPSCALPRKYSFYFYIPRRGIIRVFTKSSRHALPDRSVIDSPHLHGAHRTKTGLLNNAPSPDQFRPILAPANYQPDRKHTLVPLPFSVAIPLL